MNKTNLIWIDLEMTGLDPKYHRIIEIATLITDKNLIIIAEGPVFAIYQSKRQLLLMDEWNICTHTNTGLIDRVKESKISESVAEKKTIDFLSKWVIPGKSPICGNSVGQDRRFLFYYMPTLEKYFHYRSLDVTTIRILAKLWKPEILINFHRNIKHQALFDIKHSILELLYYRKKFIC